MKTRFIWFYMSMLMLAIIFISMPASVMAADPYASDELAYATVFEEARNGIRNDHDDWYIIGVGGYPSNDIADVAYTFYDIDGNGVNELIMATSGGGVFIYTRYGSELLRIEQWGGYRDLFDGINVLGYMHGSGSSSAWSGGGRYTKIVDGNVNVLVAEYEYEYIDEETIVLTVMTPYWRRVMSVEEFEDFFRDIDVDDVELTGWKLLTDQSGKPVGATPSGTPGTSSGGTTPNGWRPQSLVASPTDSTVLIDRGPVTFDAYLIEGNNYFKLRDIAYILVDTTKQFSVDWDDERDAITLTSGLPYVPVGGEMSGKGTGNKTPMPTTSKIYLDGREVSFTAYNIDGNNYFKLRDIGRAIDFNVDWREEMIWIETGEPYVEYE
ncbi:MAG: hypothetical protein FWH01_04030 [Oscillospiraceae bacterium]|nr:hypothetical protein [Oscillospiraceae bacterium]